MDGIVNILKPPGMSSHDVIDFCRKAFHTKKIGHTGTLDPEAAGVLPVCVGKATKLADRVGGERKSYRAVVKLGIVTDSYDLEGQILRESSVPEILDVELVKIIEKFLGAQLQMPPVYSAIKVNGRKLYEYALKGETVEIKPRECFIYRISFVERSISDEFTLDIECSKGTYIRSICHDIGEILGCGGAMKRLIRLSSGGFRIQDAFLLEEISELGTECITPVDRYYSEKIRLNVNPDAVSYIENGNPIIYRHFDEESKAVSLQLKEGDEARIYSNERFLGIAEKRKYSADKGFGMMLTYRHC